MKSFVMALLMFPFFSAYVAAGEGVQGDKTSITDNDDASGSILNYLTSGDRLLLEKIRDYCNKNEVDPDHINALEADLAVYRYSPNSIRTADLYDQEGRRFYVAFSDEDKAFAEKIYQNMSTSEFDKGYLVSRILPGGRFVNLVFLEQMVRIFSKSPSKDSELVKAFDPAGNKNVIILD